MAVQRIITSPHKFKERIMAFGDAGTGKSSLTLTIARYCPDATFHIIDGDYSLSYERLLATEYADVADRGNVVIYEVEPEWEHISQTLAQIVAEGDMSVDWLTVDPTSLAWETVQAWWSDTILGTDIADHLAHLRKESADTKEYMAAVAETMQWPAINKQFQQKFYKPYRTWKGHSILATEAKTVGRQQPDDIKKMWAGVGSMPVGQKNLPFVGATNIYLDHPDKQRWRMTTTKDRGRALIDKVVFTDFALDYLVEHAGWEMSIKKGK